MDVDLVLADGTSSMHYCVKFHVPRLSIDWEQAVDYDYLRKVKKYMKSIGYRMNSPFPNETLFRDICDDDVVMLKNVCLFVSFC